MLFRSIYDGFESFGVTNLTIESDGTVKVAFAVEIILYEFTVAEFTTHEFAVCERRALKHTVNEFAINELTTLNNPQYQSRLVKKQLAKSEVICPPSKEKSVNSENL